MEITLDDFHQKIKEYTTSSEYTPLKIDIKIVPPVYLSNPWIHLDGILSYLCLRDALDDLFYILPTDTILNIDDLDIPLKKTNDVYHSSVGLFTDIYQLNNAKIYKRFTDKETYHLTSKQQKGRVYINKGHYKDFLINMPILITDNITFYCNGDKEELSRLLSHLRHIGKKTSIGGGKVININITETTEDYSFFKDNQIMRPIPATMNIPLVEGMIFQQSNYKPPYWNSQNKTMCYVPQNQIKSAVIK